MDARRLKIPCPIARRLRIMMHACGPPYRHVPCLVSSPRHPTPNPTQAASRLDRIRAQPSVQPKRASPRIFVSLRSQQSTPAPVPPPTTTRAPRPTLSHGHPRHPSLAAQPSPSNDPALQVGGAAGLLRRRGGRRGGGLAPLRGVQGAGQVRLRLRSRLRWEGVGRLVGGQWGTGVDRAGRIARGRSPITDAFIDRLTECAPDTPSYVHTHIHTTPLKNK